MHPKALGLWDSHHLGYYAALTFPGKTIAHPATPVLSKKMKQGGQQLLMLKAFQVADTLTGGQYIGMVMAMEKVAMSKAYYAAGHGLSGICQGELSEERCGLAILICYS